MYVVQINIKISNIVNQIKMKLLFKSRYPGGKICKSFNLKASNQFSASSTSSLLITATFTQVVIMIIMIVMLIIMMMMLNITTFQVPLETAKFCKDCGLVKEPFTLATDIAFQVDNDVMRVMIIMRMRMMRMWNLKLILFYLYRLGVARKSVNQTLLSIYFYR